MLPWIRCGSPHPHRRTLKKTNATAIHAALRLAPSVGALDMGGALRSGIGTLRTALSGAGTTLVVASDIRDGMATSSDEATGGDGAAALLVGDDTEGTVIAEYLGSGVATDELLERWRIPGAARSRVWEERFGEVAYTPLVQDAVSAALAAAGISSNDVDHLALTGMHSRAVRRNRVRLGVPAEKLVDDLADSVGNTGTAHGALMLASALEVAGPDEIIVLVVLADGVEAVVLRTTETISDHRWSRSVSAQIASGAAVSYGQYLSWRQMVAVEPPESTDTQPSLGQRCSPS